MPETIGNRNVWSLHEIAEDIKSTITQKYSQSFWIKAEMVKLNHYPKSGHCYPELVQKYDGDVVAQVKGNLWKDNYQRINKRFREVTGEPLKDGISILMNAAIRFHPVYGLALDIKDIDPSFTLGVLARKKQETINKLREEGIFEKNRRLKLPLLPKRIAVISVESSKGYSDFLNVIEKNNWGYRFFHMLFPSVLQGDNAVQPLISQLNSIRRVASHFDVVAIIRGGGGDVGLSCYDDYRLAKVVAMFPLPVLTGIGHSTNETVVQMVAYRNNITPTALGEFLIQQFHNFSVPVKDGQRIIMDAGRQLLKDHKTGLENLSRLYRSSVISSLHTRRIRLERITTRGVHAVKNTVTSHKEQLKDYRKTLKREPFLFLNERQNILNSEARDTARNIRHFMVLANNNLAGTGERLRLLDPKNVLKRGYSITYLEGKSLKDSRRVNKGDRLVTELHQGKIASIVESTDKPSWKKRLHIRKPTKS